MSELSTEQVFNTRVIWIYIIYKNRGLSMKKHNNRFYSKISEIRRYLYRYER